MNFFDHQTTARKKSLLLGFLLLIAVALIVISTNLICYFIFSFSDSEPLAIKDWFASRISLSISAAVILTILVGTIQQFINLSKGGRAVADMAKGRKVDLNSQDKLEQRFVNLVEEMSIASGTMRPELYIMDQEQSINAFVAGYEPTECVLVITKGALDKLSRDELQGIIGHEFSHILNGDMRINIRLIAILAGILLIGQIGQFLLQTSFDRSHSYRSSKSKNDIVQLFVGITLICIGYTGLFMGRVIKAAISRQREFLADAASVQFTRNPEGIASALYKIFDSQEGSRLRVTRHAEDLNHLCFSESVKLHLSSLLASHPPLKERITTIDRSYLVRFKARKHAAKKQPLTPKQSLVEPDIHIRDNQPLTDNNIGFAPNTIGLSDAAPLNTPLAPTHTLQPLSAHTTAIEQTTGTVNPAHIDYAVSLLAEISSEIKTLVHTPEGAKVVVLLLMLSETTEKLHANAIKQLSKSSQDSLNSLAYRHTTKLVNTITLPQRTPIFEMAICSLRNLTDVHKQDLINDLSTIANIDGRITFFEFALATLTKQQLTNSYGRKIKSKYHSLKDVINEVALILRLFAIASTTNKQEQQSRFAHGIQLFSDNIQWGKNTTYNARQISHALNKLRLLSPLLKRPLIDSFIECVMTDNIVKPREYELLRLVAVILDCPMPPLLIPNT